ncbi:NAD(P)/FAD-dependent oxidoreductase [Levilactobacillus acidifarinae]|uniref:Glycine D-amino acid oxidase n=1 Tax=Levilactobacillus acidifarinae DSM 19394 = JCM 15949 TaxID=1423715 RepID=A0A0R1LLS9_9LACO|nr:FAD-dependent oxidoreductase [Levilactobacillus acidifarinae]KRK94483.1 glycine D-amino acid oxidase [Levilactobacillus acidifarinae DSM 19394]GEO68227.1 oxidoreductase [Levilactobacillus acidifarinae]
MQKRIAIIGGGIVGATAAYYLSTLPGAQHLKVTLYDDGNGQASKAAAGIISPWLSKRRNQQWYRLAKDGADLYPQLVHDAQLGTEVYQQTGTIVTRAALPDLEALDALAQERQKTAPTMGTVQQLTAQEVQAKLPLLTNPQAGVFLSGGAKVDGGALVDALLTQASHKNLTVRRERVKLDQDENVVTSLGAQRFDRVIIAAGAWLPELLVPLHVRTDVRAQKGQLIELAVKDYPLQENLPVLMPEGERDFVPFGHGKLIVGATHEDDKHFDLSLDAAVTADLLASAQRLMSGLTDQNITGVRVGTRAYTSDFAPFFGPLPEHDRFLVASGLGSSGLTTGPQIGRLLAGSALYGGTPDWRNYEKPLATYLTSSLA